MITVKEIVPFIDFTLRTDLNLKMRSKATQSHTILFTTELAFN